MSNVCDCLEFSGICRIMAFIFYRPNLFAAWLRCSNGKTTAGFPAVTVLDKHFRPSDHVDLRKLAPKFLKSVAEFHRFSYSRQRKNSIVFLNEKLLKQELNLLLCLVECICLIIELVSACKAPQLRSV